MWRRFEFLHPSLLLAPLRLLNLSQNQTLVLKVDVEIHKDVQRHAATEGMRSECPGDRALIFLLPVGIAMR